MSEMGKGTLHSFQQQIFQQLLSSRSLTNNERDQLEIKVDRIETQDFPEKGKDSQAVNYKTFVES